MSERPATAPSASDKPRSVHELLLQMDLATEVLEGLDELGLDTRDQVEALLAQLEREIGDAS
jgi:hypothetical protein